MSEALGFWFSALLIGAIGLPFSFRLFRRFPDAGAGLAIPLGVLVLSVGYFLLRVLSVLPPGRGGVFVAIALFGLAAVLVAGRDRRLSSTVTRTGPGILFAVLLFTGLFFLYAFYRSYNAQISGTEQPMDFMYLNAMIESPTYPPADPWFAGSPVSYYYLGYLETAVVTMAAGVEASIGYGLGLALLFASAGTAVASLATAATRWLLPRASRRLIPLGATAAVLLLLAAGSLSAWFQLASAHGAYNEDLYRAAGVADVGPCDQLSQELVELGHCHAGSASWYPDKFFWWFETSRVIPGTITEFPAFSFLLGDLHPHLMSLPGVLLMLGLAAAAWRGRGALSILHHRRDPTTAIVTAVAIGGLAFVNAWDIITFTAVLFVAVAARNLRVLAPIDAMRAGAGWIALPLGIAAVLFAPWYFDFHSQAGGFEAYVGRGTTPGEGVVQWGTLLLGPAVAVAWALGAVSRREYARLLPFALWLALIPLGLWVVLAAASGPGLDSAVDNRGGWGWLWLGVLATTTCASGAATLALGAARRPAATVAAGATLGVLLLLGAELFYIEDVFRGSVPRLNTIFKLSYQAWVVLSVAGGAALALAVARMAAYRVLLVPLVPAGAIAAASLLFYVVAVPERTGGFNNPTTLDGLDFVARIDPDEYRLERWIADELARDERFIEAPGESYRELGRVSGRTGRPTVLGWRFHEAQWRGAAGDAALDAELARRQELIDGAYQAGSDPEPLERLLNEFDARYVVVGRSEIGKYPSDGMTDFDRFLDVAFESGAYRVYRVPISEDMATS